ncbi:MAG: hypothetical protein HZB92_04390 [Euryarchaeota archaeon]|nr:hypothetical protein [Euryarchaeota archaeon]
MKSRATLSLQFKDDAEASAVASALKIDDGGFIETELKGKEVVASAEAKDPMALLHTLDDWLACATTAEKAVKESRRAR